MAIVLHIIVILFHMASSRGTQLRVLVSMRTAMNMNIVAAYNDLSDMNNELVLLCLESRL